MAETIAFVLRNLPVFLFVAALALAAAWRTGAPGPDRLVAWVLLLPIGVRGLWAAVFHLFFGRSPADMGWEVSPFQSEVGVADLAIGATACVSFWRSLEFKAAAVLVNAIALIGDAVGHVKQMIVADNFAPGNAGVPFYSDLIFPALSIILLIIVQRSQGLSSDAKCNTPRRLDIGKVVQDLKECVCDPIGICRRTKETRSAFCGPRGGRWGPLPGRLVGRKPPSPGNCSGTLSPRADIRRFTPPEPINCAGSVKRSSNERLLYACSWGIVSPKDGRPNRSPVG